MSNFFTKPTQRLNCVDVSYTFYIQFTYTLHWNIKIIDTKMIPENWKREPNPKVKTWDLVHSDFNRLDFRVELLETQPNAKHQKLTLLIDIICQSEQTVYRKQFKTSDLPSHAITIFHNVQILFEYIEQFYNDRSRIIFNPDQNTLTIVNIVVMKSKELKQEVVLCLDKQKYIVQKINPQILDKNMVNNEQVSSFSSKQIFEESKALIESLVKDKNAVLENKVAILSEYLNDFVKEISFLKQQNKEIANVMNQCTSQIKNIKSQTSYLNQKVIQLQIQQTNMNTTKQPSSSSDQTKKQLQEVKKELSQHKWHIDQLTFSVANVHEAHVQLEKKNFKIQEGIKSEPRNDTNLLPLVNQVKKEIVVINTKLDELRENSSRLGHKIFVNIDTKTNKYMDNFRIIENIVEKISADEQRHQLLGRESFNLYELKSKCYFEIKVISTVNAQVVIGIVGDVRKNERYSYDKKECVCYDGQGFIFEQGQKIKMPCQFYAGQTIRVVIDPFEALIQWFVGYTEIGSTSIPETMRKMKIVPYFELYCITDKVAING